ncbi:hypothetical protein SPFM15_00117 [Salmonella phage SPFM15]|nr:hypothetical protein SPFM5_00112 [Salmonella phage SPFM5]VFR13741.1 hypothetical protein SPFM15_00117 [Salmonella phage SPFM15]
MGKGFTFFRCSSGFIGEVPTPITIVHSPTYSFSDVNPYTGEGKGMNGNVNTTTGERYYRINKTVNAWDGGKLESPMMFKDTIGKIDLQMMPRSVTVMDVGANWVAVIYTCTGTQEKFVDYRPVLDIQSPSNIGQFSATPVKNHDLGYSMKRLFIVFAIINLLAGCVVGLIWQ